MSSLRFIVERSIGFLTTLGYVGKSSFTQSAAVETMFEAISAPTDGLVKGSSHVVMLFTMHLLEQLAAKLQLLRGAIVFDSLRLAHLLWKIGVQKVFWGRGVYFSLWSTHCYFGVRPSNDRH